MHKDIAVKLQNISKVYRLYNKPIDRLKEALHPLKKKYHKEFYALKDINLEIKKGQVLGIVGVNGAGKSTLLKIIAGVLTPSHGRVLVNGRINAILELSSGLKPEMTGRENIKLNLQINGIYNNIEKLIAEIIEFADIGEHIDQPVKSYSSGMKARLGFGLATSTDPDVLIVDEVLAVGDVLFQRKCFTRIENLFKNGKTVIFVSHSAQSVVEFCSHALLLYDREIIVEDTPKKVTDFYQKLVFSKDQKQIVDEIKGKKLAEPKEVETNILKKEVIEDEKFYLPDFKSEPTEYKNTNTKIFDIKLINKNGNKVNILKTHEKYIFQYNVQFDDHYKNISFGFMFKTLKGQEISGLNTHLAGQDIVQNVQVNEIYTIEFTFTCMLLQGDYLLNAGVAVHNGREIIFLNRIIDSYIFRVEPQSKKVSGLVDQSYKISTRLTSK